VKGSVSDEDSLGDVIWYSMSHSLTLGYGGAWSRSKTGAQTGHPLLPQGYEPKHLLINSSGAGEELQSCHGEPNPDRDPQNGAGQKVPRIQTSKAAATWKRTCLD
jgi:hypothetical protein